MDLDNTLIVTESGEKFPKHYRDWKFKPGVVQALCNFFRENPQAGHLIIISNQGGIMAGHVREEDFKKKAKEVIETLRQHFGQKQLLVKVDLFYCPSIEPHNFHRKPNPGLGYMAAMKYEIPLIKAMYIGDAGGNPGDPSDSDLQFSFNAGFGHFLHIETFLNTFGNE